MAKFYEEFIRPDDLCFDLGSHVGSRVRTWLSLRARVVAVEPQPACAVILRRIYESHPSVVLEEAAIGERTGEAEFRISTRSPRISTLSREWIGTIRDSHQFRKVRWNRTVKVPVVTLDDLIRKHGIPVFCKIDIEGYELQALHGLSTPLRALSFEYVLPRLDLAGRCIGRLEELGPYEFNWSFGEHMIFDLDHWVDGTAMKQLLHRAPSEFRAGDVYARLRSS